MRMEIRVYNIGGSCHKYHFCRNKTRPLSQQKYACCDKTFVTRKTKTKILMSQQAYFCHDKRCVLLQQTCVMTKVSLSQQNFLATKFCLSWQIFVATKNHDKHTFVTRKDMFCHDKMFVMEKMILVAVPANDSIIHEIWGNHSATCLFLAGRHSADAVLISIFSLCTMRRTSKKRNSWNYRNLSMKRSHRYVWQLAFLSTFFTAACICQVFTWSLSCHLNPNVPSFFLFCSLPTLSLSPPPLLSQ